MKHCVVLSTHPAQFAAVAFKGSYVENVAKIAAWGYDGVELAIRDPKLVDPDETLALLARHGLALPAIGTGQAWGEEHLSFTDPDQAVRRAAVERCKEHIPLAARSGALIIVGLLRGIVKPGVDRSDAMAWMIAALRECCSVAGESGVRIALEPINRYETTLINNVAQGLELIDSVGLTNLGLLLDTFHMNIEEPSIEESIRRCGHHTFHFHVADSNRWYPGAGHLQWRSILGALQGTGYRGFVSGEFMPLPDGETAADEAIRFLHNLE
jgi:5-keto-L-gluconate epimerase